MPAADTPSAVRAAAVPILLNLDETAEALRLSRRSVDTLVADGSLASIKIGRRRLVPAKALRAFIDARTEETAAS